MPAPTPAPASEGTEACQCHSVTHRGCAGRVSPTAGSHSPGPWPLGIFPSRPGIWHHTKGSQDSRTYSPTRGISRPLSGGHLPCFGGAAFLSCSPSIKRVLTRSQNGNLGPLVSSPQPTSSAVSPIQSSGLPRRNSKTSRWLAVLRWPLASAQDWSQDTKPVALIGQHLLSVSLPPVRALYHAVFLKAHGSLLLPVVESLHDGLPISCRRYPTHTRRWLPTNGTAVRRLPVRPGSSA